MATTPFGSAPQRPLHLAPGDDNDVVEGEVGADVLDFNGSAAAETIDVSANGPRVRLLRNIANVVTDLGGVERVQIDALAGSDTLVAGDTAGTELQAFAVNLNGFNGAGDTVPTPSSSAARRRTTASSSATRAQPRPCRARPPRWR